VDGACGKDGRGENMYKFLVGKPEGGRPLGRQGRKCENGIRMDWLGRGGVLSEFTWLRKGTAGGLS
jgi:hypothetical protein